jgi:hypothetical protein
MTLDDIKDQLDISDADLVKYLQALQKRKVVGLQNDRRGALGMARITLTGLAEAHPPEYYRYIPPWVNKRDIF